MDEINPGAVGCVTVSWSVATVTQEPFVIVLQIEL